MNGTHIPASPGAGIAAVPECSPAFGELLAEARLRGVRVCSGDLAGQGVDVLVVDLAAASDADWQRLGGVRPRHWIALGGTEPLATRLRALQAGMTGYHVPPLPAFDILELAAVAAPEMDAPLQALVVDDDALLAEYHAAVLRSGGMEVRTLTDPTGIWPLLEARLPDVIVLDLHMAGIGGDKLAGLIERDQRYAHIPVVFLSGDGDVLRQQEALQLGGADFLVKPVRQQHLIVVAKRHARRCRGLSELRHAWNAARYEAETLRRAIDAHAIVSGTDVQGRIIFVNDKFCEVFGYRADELLGRDHRMLKSGRHPPEFYAEMWRTIASGRIWSGELCNRRKDGSLHWTQATIVPFKDGHGQLQRYVAIRTDITEVKRVNLELEAARAEAEKANQAKTAFLSRMSHELRTPMNAILGFAQLLTTDRANPLGEGAAENVNQILRAGWHLLELINEVLDLSRIESGNFGVVSESVDLVGVLADCHGIMQPIAGSHGIALQLAPPPAAAARVRADRTRLRQVLINLMSNGIKYNRPGGTVGLRLSIAGDEVAVAVADSGLGLTAAERQQLFEPFARFHDGAGVEGTGIGLTIARSLVEMMGGRIGVDSEPGVGSTFTVFLPLEAGAGEGASAGDDVAPPPATNLRVLYVEDSLADLELARRLFRDTPGTELITARSGPEGVEKALTERPDLIVLDIGLPGFDGFAAKEMLAAYDDTLHIPVVALSAVAHPADIDKSRRLGFVDYVTKPLDVARVRELVASHRNRKSRS